MKTALAVKLAAVLVPPLVALGSVMLLVDVIPAVSAAPLLGIVLKRKSVGRAIPSRLAADVEGDVLRSVHVALRLDRVLAAPASDLVAKIVSDCDRPVVV